jgi:hypothetical protein
LQVFLSAPSAALENAGTDGRTQQIAIVPEKFPVSVQSGSSPLLIAAKYRCAGAAPLPDACWFAPALRVLAFDRWYESGNHAIAQSSVLLCGVGERGRNATVGTELRSTMTATQTRTVASQAAMAQRDSDPPSRRILGDRHDRTVLRLL